MKSLLLFATTNYGKYKILKEYVGEQINIQWFNQNNNIIESSDALDNASRKAIYASKLAEATCISNDDSLWFTDFNASNQPSASIYRHIQDQHSDKNIIEYYQKLFLDKGIKETTAMITSIYAIAFQGNLINHYKCSYEFLFKIPSSQCHEIGMPLSAFHFVPYLNKYYSELTSIEKHSILTSQFGGLVLFIKKNLDNPAAFIR